MRSSSFDRLPEILVSGNERLSRRKVLTTTAALAALMLAPAAGSTAPKKRKATMRVKDVFLLICTPKLYECRDFYVQTFGFKVGFESSIYIQLHIAGDSGGPGFSLAFMPPRQPFGPNFAAPYDGNGAYVTIEVEDAKARFEQVRASGAPIVQPLRDEGWGQRHFVTRDPHGTLVDVVQGIDPAPGYYDHYQIERKPA